MSGLSHLVVTRFAIRRLFAAAQPDPLAPARLRHRLRLLESIARPALLAQTCTDFRWLVLVDEALPAAFRDQLERVVGVHRDVVVKELDGRGPDALAAAIAAATPAGTRRLLQTILDDDDALHRDVVAWLQDEVRDLSGDSAVHCPVRFLGLEDALQWDLVPEHEAPFGYAKPWVRRDFAGRPFPVSAGFSVCAPFPDVLLTPEHVSHAIVKNVLRPGDSRVADRSGLAQRVIQARAFVSSALAPTPWREQSLSLEEHYRVCSLTGPQCVMTNHAGNAQKARLAERADLREAVVPGRSFDGVGVDWMRVEGLLGPRGCP